MARKKKVRKSKANPVPSEGALVSTVLEVWTTETFREQPERAGDALRQVHAYSDPEERYNFMAEYVEFDYSNPTEAQFDGLFSGGMPQALLEVALDKRLYEHYPDDPDLADYLLSVFTALTSMVHHAVDEGCTHSSHKAGPGSQWAEEVLDTLPRLWTVIWDYTDYIYADPWEPDEDDAEDDMDYCGHVVDVLMSQIALSRPVRGRPPSIHNNNAAHIALVCWCAAYDKASLSQLDAVFASYYEMCTTGDFQTFVGRALTRKTVTAERFVIYCNFKLLVDDVVDGELACLMNNLGWFFTHPQMKRSRSLDDEHALNLLRAAQRQVCTGNDTFCEWSILRHAFSMVGDMMMNDRDRKPTGSREFLHSIVLLLARAVVLGAMETDLKKLVDLEGMISLFAISGAALEGAGPEERDLPEWMDFRGSVHQVWHRAHDDLKGLSPGEAPHLSLVTKWWLDFGKKCGVDVEAPYEPPAEIAGATGTWAKDNGCAWKECLCFGERPYHRLRRCKRCENVLYCSTKCQTKDWKEGGHKLICKPPAR